MNKNRKQNHSLWFISILLLIGSILLFNGGPDYYSSRSLKYFWDTGHILYFALLTVLLARWRFVSRMSLTGQWATILTVSLLVGVSIEFMQYGTTRIPSTGDLLKDLTGSLLVLVFGPLGAKLQPVNQKRFLQLSVLALTLVQLWPLTRSLIDEAISQYQFPLLSGFETPFEIERWAGGDRISIETFLPVSSDNLLKLTLTTEKYSGAELKYFDGNWASARTLKISLYNPDTTPLRISCRIHDLQHIDGNQDYEDRYNRSFLLIPGWNQININLDEVKQSPADRHMDMSRIHGVILFTVSLPAPRVLYLKDVRLAF